ncbi:MAG: hypothetical protein V4692_10430, partial [Bdellovibrionota bacterium]
MGFARLLIILGIIAMGSQSLAESRLFFTWAPEEQAVNTLEHAGQPLPGFESHGHMIDNELIDYIAEKQNSSDEGQTVAGEGLYVASTPFASSKFGTTLLIAEVLSEEEASSLVESAHKDKVVNAP